MGTFSLVLHMMAGLGWPVATHLSRTLSPSRTTMGVEEKICCDPTGQESKSFKVNFREKNKRFGTN